MPTSSQRARRAIHRRAIVQWSIVGIVLITIGLGWWFPWLGFSVPIVMAMGVIGSLFNGRYVCGNLCPRGSFYDRLMPPLSRKRPIPNWIRSSAFRWTLFALLMGFMVFRILQNPTDPMHWGRVFWVMCVVTTLIGIPLALLIHPRTWCSFCPIGTVQSAIGGGRGQLQIDAKACRTCGLCEKKCPMGLSIAEHRQDECLPHRDCLRCSECVAICPVGALEWPSRPPD